MKRFAGEWLQLRTEYLEVCGLPLFLNAIVGPDGIVLLDSGVADTPQTSVRGELAAAGLRIEDVSLVVNSHAHPDHMGGNASMDAIAGPRFAAPAAEAAWLEDNERVIRELWNPNPDAYQLTGADRVGVEAQLGDRMRIDLLLRDGDAIEVGGSPLTVVTTSGHSPGHIAVHDAPRQVLFTFDDVQGDGLPIAHSDIKLAPLYHDVERYLGGLRRLRELDFATLVPAHGEHLDRAAALDRIDQSIAFVEQADAFVAEQIDRAGRVRLGEVAGAIGTELGPYGGVNLQTMSIAKAHLDQQVRRGELVPMWHKQEDLAET